MSRIFTILNMLCCPSVCPSFYHAKTSTEITDVWKNLRFLLKYNIELMSFKMLTLLRYYDRYSDVITLIFIIFIMKYIIREKLNMMKTSFHIEKKAYIRIYLLPNSKIILILACFHYDMNVSIRFTVLFTLYYILC